MEHTVSPAGNDITPELQQVLDGLHGRECVYFPVRHHSPACAWHLAQLIRALRPSSILIEGPASFTPLIPTLLDPATKPPVAFYTHFIDVDRQLYKPAEGELDLGPARFAAYYPFCEYSPELVALRVGQETGARLSFIDLDYPEQVIAEHATCRPRPAPRVVTLMEERRLERSAYLQALARRCGCRDFNEMWDHLFEANFRALSTERFMRDVATYCYFARCEATPEALEADGTSARERAMAGAVDAERSLPGSLDARILVVTGGFHSVVLPGLAGKGHAPAKSVLRSADSVQQAFIRYSFEQLDVLNGYSAGMPSPYFYNRLWRELEAGNPAPHSTLAAQLVVEIGAMTRKKDMQPALSAADEIAALQQARMLAALRGHPGPMREDLLDGMRSCFVKGSMDAEGATLLGIVSHVLTGSQIGEVPAAAGAPPLVTSFRREAELARLDIRNSVKKHLTLEIYRKETHRRTSRFLHSVTFLGVPFSVLVAGPDFVRGHKLENRQEKWDYAWSPLTEGALVDVSIYGATIEDAATNRLREAIGQLEQEGRGRDASQAVAMLIRACRMGLHRHVGRLLALIAARVGDDPSFIGAIGAANQLLLLWQSREPLQAHNLVEVPQLMRAAYIRACYLVSGLAQCPEEELPAALDALASVRELLTAAQDELLDADLFWQPVRQVIANPNHAHVPYSTICGAMAGLLYSAGRMDAAQLSVLVEGYLEGIAEWQKRAGFLRGLLRTCREAAWQNRQLVKSLDAILAAWREEEFVAALPDLRLALAELTPRETDKVASVVAGLHGQERLSGLVQTGITEGQMEVHRRVTAGVLEVLAKDGLSHWLGANPNE